MLPKDNLYRWCKQQRDGSLRRLKDLESGRWTIGEYVDGKLVDQTQASIAILKREIDQSEAIIAEYERVDAEGPELRR
jgi:hypothetical protein